MTELIIHLSDAECAELADLADATGHTPEEYALAAVRDRLRAEREAVAGQARRLAERHAALLERLGA
ncbi:MULTISPECIES: hypothetical protein [unclassified Streptomyces]|uniref:hypothetical protein n=1 Tax=unclassified Streptomyces TaxID=2593676 RepID=UPI002E0F9E2A|nr:MULTISPECIES: hypothetical protein [unclassified Streptomyces]WSR26245.1 hypothetical protein OG573_08915 [Streptomyces sp. NBC_01205]